ncbi:calcium ion binding [Mactra antiquata]
MDNTLMLAFLLVCTAGSAYGWWGMGREWSDTIPSDCPSEDPETHVCRSLYGWNTTCLYAGCCRDFENLEYHDESTDDYHSDEGASEYSEQSCTWCFVLSACTYYKCFDRCCDGYERDIYGRCSNATGGIECQNGGTIILGLCLCPHGFSGRSCEIPQCQCENEGDCIVKDGQPFCNCSRDYEGERCETARCTMRCQNGGVCHKRGEHEMCRCQESFFGKYCQYTSSDTCPAHTNYQTEYFCETRCETNEECSGNQVCCKEGCSTRCREPVSDYCEYMDRIFRVGQSFAEDKCTNCTCMEDGHMNCYPEPCEANCVEPIYKEGECCPICLERPTIHNRPMTTVYINTTDGDYAELCAKKLGMYATDYRNQTLQVSLTPSWMRRFRIYNQVPGYVKASAVDHRGSEEIWWFSVVVRDVTPPVFTSCPGNIFVFDDEPVEWVEPGYFDNVGVAGSKKTGYGENGDVFPVGEYYIKYYAWDYDRNTAECVFKVFVVDRDTDFESLPEGLRQRSKNNRSTNLAYILAPILVILAAIILIVCCFVCYKKRQAQGASTRHSPASYDNNIYTVPSDAMDKVKPPAYPGPPLPQNPPTYSDCGSVRYSSYKPESPPSYNNPEYDMEK